MPAVGRQDFDPYTYVPLVGTVPAGGTLSAARVADVLLTITAYGEPVGLSELARSLGLSKAVVHRILRSLEARGLVASHQKHGTYGVGPAAAAIGVGALQDLADGATAALPHLRRLQTETGETATVSALIGSARAYLDQVVSSREVKMSVELRRPYPLHAGSSGKAILAFVAPGLQQHVLEHQLATLTEATITDPVTLRRELDVIAAEGIAVSFGERERGAGSLAAPIFGMDDAVFGSISVCGPLSRFGSVEVERFTSLVKQAAHDTTCALRRASRQTRGKDQT